MLRLHEALITLLILEEVDEDLALRGGQAQLLVDLLAQLGQLLEERQAALDLEVGQEDELPDAELILARRPSERFLVGALRIARNLRKQMAAGHSEAAQQDHSGP